MRFQGTWLLTPHSPAPQSFTAACWSRFRPQSSIRLPKSLSIRPCLIADSPTADPSTLADSPLQWPAAPPNPLEVTNDPPLLDRSSTSAAAFIDSINRFLLNRFLSFHSFNRVDCN